MSFLDWRGIIITFVWKQTPFVTLLLAGAMASIDRATIEAGRNLGASRLRMPGRDRAAAGRADAAGRAVLSFVTMMSVLSVPMMVAGSQPTMMTVDMAFRINAYGDYPRRQRARRHLLPDDRGGRLVLSAPRPARRRRAMTAHASPAPRCRRHRCSGCFAFVLIGPLANLVLWSVAERWYSPYKLPVDLRLALLGGGVPPDRRRHGVARDQRLIALLTVVVALARLDPGRLRAGAAASCRCAR